MGKARVSLVLILSRVAKNKKNEKKTNFEELKKFLASSYDFRQKLK
jgi:hypothetical protein